MRASHRSLFQELEKIAIDPWLGLAGLDAAQGAYSLMKNRPQEGGRSSSEQKSLKRVANPLLNQDELVRELKEHKKNVSASEGAGSGLATAGVGGLGFLGKELSNKDFLASEIGNRTTPQDVDKLYNSMVQPTPGKVYVSMVPPGTAPEYPEGLYALEHAGKPDVILRPEADTMKAHHIPKGGFNGRLGRAAEVDSLRRRGLTDLEIDRGLSHGLSILPGKAGPHVAAHEMGHLAFEGTRLGKLTRGLRNPILMGATVGSGYLANKADPDSTASKLAPLVAATGLVPTLGEEAYATVKGLSGMRRAGYSSEAVRQGAKQLGKAFGSYGLKYGLPAIAAPMIIRKIRQNRMEQRRKAGLETSSDISEAIRALRDQGE